MQARLLAEAGWHWDVDGILEDRGWASWGMLGYYTRDRNTLGDKAELLVPAVGAFRFRTESAGKRSSRAMKFPNSKEEAEKLLKAETGDEDDDMLKAAEQALGGPVCSVSLPGSSEGNDDRGPRAYRVGENAKLARGHVGANSGTKGGPQVRGVAKGNAKLKSRLINMLKGAPAVAKPMKRGPKAGTMRSAMKKTPATGGTSKSGKGKMKTRKKK